ncbi:WxL protein peptidoglycan domain-containing protein [Cellulomonas hominis]
MPPRAVVVLLLLVALAATVLATAPTATAADDTLTWSVRPVATDGAEQRANFAYEADPGEVLTDGFAITNYGDETLVLRVYAADAFTTSSGQLDLLPAGEASTDLGRWVALGQDEVTVAPGAVVEVPFTVTVPADARPGDHTGGIVTSFVTTQAGTTVSLDRRLGSRMHLRVSGELTPALTVSEPVVTYHQSANPFGASTATVRYTVTNTGNARLTATEQVTVSGVGGVATATAPDGTLPELLPGGSLDREVQVAGVWPLVRAAAEVTLLPEAVGIGGGTVAPVAAAGSVWAVPWALLAVVALVVVASVWGPGLVARRRGLPAPAVAGPAPDAVPADPR